jgi:hypothetical protein
MTFFGTTIQAIQYRWAFFLTSLGVILVMLFWGAWLKNSRLLGESWQCIYSVSKRYR